MLKIKWISFIRSIPILGNALENLRLKRVKRNFFKKVKSTPPVLVYQMGKVASISVYRSIRDSYNGIVLHAHRFVEDHEKQYLSYLYEIYNKEKIFLKIISLVREPIGRNISSFFENFKKVLGKEYNDNDYSIDELKNHFLNDYPHEYPLTWFDDNIKKNFNIDVFKYEFPDDNYLFINENNLELLILKHDLADNIKERLISKFLDLDNFSLNNANITADKEYSNAYNQLKKLKYPVSFVDKMLNSDYAKHFYKNDLDRLRKKWLEE